MPEALARTSHDAVLSGDAAPRRRAPAAAPQKAARPAASRAKAGTWRARLLAQPMRTVVTGALAAVALGIVVNAMALQKTRHPAPLFVGPAKVDGAQKAAAAPAPRPAAPEIAAPVRVAAADPAPAERLHPPGKDPIAQLLLRPHVDGADASRRVLATQTALQKLGFPLKIDGVMGGTTRQAIEQFERDRGLPVKGDLTPRIARALAAQSGVAIP